MPSTRHSTTQLREGLAAALVSRPKKQRSVMIAATLVAGINDARKDAQALAEFLLPLRNATSKIAVDLIPYNDIGVPGFVAPTRARVQQFQTILQDEGYFVSVRMTRGDDESAACGQLSTSRSRGRKSSSSSSSSSSSEASVC